MQKISRMINERQKMTFIRPCKERNRRNCKNLHRNMIDSKL